MQTVQMKQDFYREDKEYKHYKTVKHIRNDDDDDQREHLQKPLSPHNTRSMSSNFRDSIRHLASCASARRKPGRNSNHNKNGSSTLSTNVPIEGDFQHSPKTFLSSVKFSSSHKHANRSTGSTIPSTVDEIPPALPPRKPLDKKNSVQMSSAILNPSVLDNSSSQLSSSAADDTSSLAPMRVLPSKEISTSLVNLMGTASESITVNNSTQPTTTTQEARLRKNSVFSFVQRISAAPAVTIDRLGSLTSTSIVAPSSTVESPSTQRQVYPGNHSTTSHNKSSQELTWCYESTTPVHTNGGTSFDDCLPQLEIDDKPFVYRQQFEAVEHFNWYGVSESCGPVIISYKHAFGQNKQRIIQSIIRTRQQTFLESVSDLHASATPIEILRRLCGQSSIADIEYFDPVLSDGTHDFLLKYDESLVSTQHKFGVIYQCEHQVTEEDIFSNETHSVAMDKFLRLIGGRVKLKNFPGFRGGLDVKSDQTGTESIYEQFRNHEIMFHVSTLLPHSKSDRQQLERKRHIGNDIVAIVFQETETVFNPECIASQFLHAYLVVTPLDQDGTQFKVSVVHRDSVPSFGPIIHHPASFHCDQSFKQWLLTKLINAEIASCRASTLNKYQERTRMTLFENLYRTLHDNNRTLMNFVLHHSQYKHECDVEQQQQREEAQTKASERHADSSLLGSVRRRLIAPKLRVQNSTATDNGKSSSPAAATIIVTTPPASNDSRSKTRSMTMDLRRSVSRESITTNGHPTTNGNSHAGKMTSFFSSSKTNSPRLDKSTTSRSLLDHETEDSSSSSRSNTKFLSPATCPSSPWTSGPTNGFPTSASSHEFNQNGDFCLPPTNFHFNNKSSADDTDHDLHMQLSPDDLYASSKDDLIKFVLTLQQQHSTKLAQMDQSHSSALKRLELQLMQQQSAVDRDSP